jgi:2-polyprenyl-6-methoxyphenol hydroxylase-like FAD-dependent oxidoreductase
MDHLENETSFVPPKNAVIVCLFIKSCPQELVAILTLFKIGGSLSGLMHGIVLHRLGCAVRILEQAPTETPVSHMAGVCLGPDVLRLLQRFDSFHHVALGIPSELLQSLDRNGQARPFLRAGRIMSSWDTLYYRLRANFDGFSSSYIPDPKLPEPRMGELADRAKLRAVYETARHVTVLEQLGTGQIQVTYTNSNNGCEQTTVADIVIGADGPNSVTRRLMLGDAGPRRSYAGYVAWRGVVPEDQVTPATREIFRENITYSILDGRGGHVIM